MNGIITWFATNKVAANLLMVMIMAGGLLTLPQIRKELYPALSLDKILIAVPYPGASAEEVEKSIVIKVEEAIQGLTGVDQIVSFAREGYASVIVHVSENYGTSNLLSEIKNQVDGITTFPKDAEKPLIKEQKLKFRSISVAVTGNTGEKNLKELGERVRDKIVSLPGISQAELSNVRPYELAIEISENSLKRYGLKINDIVRAIRESSLNLPGGVIKQEGGDVFLVTKSQANSAADFEDIVVYTSTDGTRLTIGDVAKVKDGFAEEEHYARFNGKPAVVVRIFRVGKQDILELSNAVNEFVEKQQLEMPEGIGLTVWLDESVYFKGRVDILSQSAVTGFALVLLILLIFLRVKLAFWVSLGIPVSFLGAFWLMPYFDVSFNEISIFAFILVLGILVDDAIVVGEAIHYRQENGEPGLKGAIEGTKEVAKPLTFAVLTTMVAFSPILFLPGVGGDFYKAIPIVIILSLVFSLIESLFILPAHLSGIKARETKIKKSYNPVVIFQDKVIFLLDHFVINIYRPFLEICLNLRYLTLATFLAVFIITVSIVTSGWVRMVFYPDMIEDILMATVTMPQGSSIEETERVINHIEGSLEIVKKEFDAKIDRKLRANDFSVVKNSLSIVGEHSRGGRYGTVTMGSHLGEVNVELASLEQTRISTHEFLNRWREEVGEIPEVVELTFGYNTENQKESINIQVIAQEYEVMPEVAQAIKDELAKYSGVYDIVDSYRLGKEELQVKIKPEAEHLGLSIKELAQQIRQGFHGVEAQRIQRGKDDIKVVVRYPKDQRRSIADIESMFVRTPEGTEIPFVSVANISFGRGLADIQRSDRRRTVNISANIDPALTSTQEIMRQLKVTGLFQQLKNKYPGIDIGTYGAQKNQQEILERLIKYFLLALIVIYAMMAIPFSSYVQPIIVMTAIPFGYVGAVFGHMLMGMDMSLLSLTGIVAVTGVVVNDSLVLMDYINRQRIEGMSIYEAIRKAGVVRFRPILLTSLTTFIGLSPLMFNDSVYAQHLVPMGVSMAYGVIFATVITLLFVPVSYAILYDILKLMGSKEAENVYSGFQSPYEKVVSDYKSKLDMKHPAIEPTEKDDKLSIEHDEEFGTINIQANKEDHEVDNIDIQADRAGYEEEIDDINFIFENDVVDDVDSAPIVKETFDTTSDFKEQVVAQLQSKKLTLKFSQLCFIVPSSHDLDFFAYQVKQHQDPQFEQFRIPETNGQFFNYLLKSSKVIAVNNSNINKYRSVMTTELLSFINSPTFIAMSVYLMDVPLGIIFAVPEDKNKVCTEEDIEDFKVLSSHFYKAIETMVDVV